MKIKILTCLVFGTALTEASRGDSTLDYRMALDHCARVKCSENSTASANEIDLSWDLRLFGWTCLDKCKYDVMHEMVRAYPSDVQQYYGKWPFYRLSGIQEPASVVFSLMNLYAQYLMLQTITKKFNREYFLFQALRFSCLVQIHSWFWSAVFHCRDLPLTEKLDYFGAMANLLAGLYVCVLRIFPRLSVAAVRLVLVLFFVCHVVYLSSRDRFDYQYNMIASLIVGLLHNTIWLVYSVARLRTHESSQICLAGIFLITMAIGLEVFDFPPVWGVFDAHSLWHLATFFVAFVWRAFIVADYREMVGPLDRGRRLKDV